MFGFAILRTSSCLGTDLVGLHAQIYCSSHSLSENGFFLESAACLSPRACHCIDKTLSQGVVEAMRLGSSFIRSCLARSLSSQSRISATRASSSPLSFSISVYTEKLPIADEHAVPQDHGSENRPFESTEILIGFELRKLVDRLSISRRAFRRGCRAEMADRRAERRSSDGGSLDRHAGVMLFVLGTDSRE